jgi:histidyl-tRNA synthetase
MKRADVSGARYAVLIGDDEVASAAATVKPLRGGDQFAVPVAALAATLSTTTPSPT